MNTNGNISFDDSNLKFKSRVILGQSQTPGMVKFLVNKGLVKNEKQANYLMIVITILFLLSSIYIFAAYVFDVNLFDKKSSVTPEQIQANKERVQQLREKAKNNMNTQNEVQPQ